MEALRSVQVLKLRSQSSKSPNGLANAAKSKEDELAPEENPPSDKEIRQRWHRLRMGLERRNFQDSDLFETLCTKISFCLRSDVITKGGAQPKSEFLH